MAKRQRLPWRSAGAAVVGASARSHLTNRLVLRQAEGATRVQRAARGARRQVG